MFKPKTLDQVRALILERVTKQLHPMVGAQEKDIHKACDLLNNLEPEHWLQVWTKVAKPYEERGLEAEKQGNFTKAKDNYLLAHNYYFLGRFSSPPDTPSRHKAFRSAVATYLKAATFFDPPLERVVIPFPGKDNEGNKIPAYLRKPKGLSKTPIVIQYGGLDEFKEEVNVYAEPLLQRGIATLAVDMPGTGEAPVKGSTDAERICSTTIDYVQNRNDLDGSRIGLMGISFGGYWVAKFAHTEQRRLSAVAAWGGPIHYYFQPDWVRQSRHAPSYICDLGLLRAHVFGCSSFEEWIDYAPKLSLLTLGILDQPSAPLLLVNGKEDTQVPIEDLYLLMEHGSPKTARIFPGGHMGRTPQTVPTIVDWLSNQLLTKAR